MEQRYTFTYDREADRRFGRAWAKREFVTRITHWLNTSIVYAIGMIMLIYVANLIPEEQSTAKYLVFPLTMAAVGYGVYLLSYYRNKQISQEVAYADQLWTCVLTDESYTVFDRKGIGLTIPWREMELIFETDDIWVIQYDRGQISIDREPLRLAGLEETFRSRVRIP